MILVKIELFFIFNTVNINKKESIYYSATYNKQ